MVFGGFKAVTCQESLEIKRRHAFMLAGTMLNDYSILVASDPP